MAKKKTTKKYSQLPAREIKIGEKLYLLYKDRKTRETYIMLNDEKVFSTTSPLNSYSRWLKAERKKILNK